LFENLRSFKVVKASDLISWLDFLLNNLFICFGHCVIDNVCIGIPMGTTNCAIYFASFYLFSYEFNFLKCLLKSNTCHVMLHRLSLVRRFVDDLFVHNFPHFENFMYLHQDSFSRYDQHICQDLCVCTFKEQCFIEAVLFEDTGCCRSNVFQTRLIEE
jgi:hypothetical protein